MGLSCGGHYLLEMNGAEQVALGGMPNLHAFPKCPRIEDLKHWLRQWQINRKKYGADLPETHLKKNVSQHVA